MINSPNHFTKILNIWTLSLLINSLLFSSFAFGFVMKKTENHVMVGLNESVEAGDGCLLIVSKMKSSNNKNFNISQVCDGRFEYLYEFPLQKQLIDGKFIGKKFQDGVVFVSDLQLPFSKHDGIHDVFDGLLMLKVLKPALSNVLVSLNAIKSITVKFSPDMSEEQLKTLVQQYEFYKSQIALAVSRAEFGGYHILQAHYPLEIPINNGEAHIDIAMLDLDVFPLYGWNLNASNIEKIGELSANTIKKINDLVKKNVDAEAKLLAIAKHDSILTTIDLNQDVIAVRIRAEV